MSLPFPHNLCCDRTGNARTSHKILMIGTTRDDNAIENGDPYCLRTAFADRHQCVDPLRDRNATSKG